MEWIKREPGLSSALLSSPGRQREQNSFFSKDDAGQIPFGNVSGSQTSTAGHGYSFNQLAASQAALGAKEDPPVVSTNYLEITERLLKQGSQYQQKHENNSRTLAGTHVALGSEQHPESVKDFLDGKRRAAVDTLIRSEENFTEQKRKIYGYLTPDVEWEKFKEQTISAHLAAGNDGVIAQLRNQRLRNAGNMTLGASGDRVLTKEEHLFAQVLRECNDEIIRTHSHVPNLADRFRAVVPSFPLQQQEPLWNPLAAIISALRDESHAFLSQEQTAYYRLSENFNRRVITAARKYLEKSALDTAEEQARNPVRDFSSDTKNDLSAVVDYTRMQISRSRLNTSSSGGNLYGVPVWALLYYAVRMGAVKTAVKLCERSEEARDFSKYLTEYDRNDGSLLASSQLELQTLYRSQLTSIASSDVYRKCLLAIMSRSESDIDLPSVTNSVNDWLWIKLAQAEPALSSSSSQNLTLSALQQMVLAKFPPQKTSDTEAFLAFILTGQFELAVERLFLNVKLRAHAVNMAICLKQVNLLLFSLEPKIGAVLVEKDPFFLLDFGSVVRIYVDSFRKQHMDVALEYHFHLTDSPSVQSTVYDHHFQNLFEFCLYKLAKDTGKYTELFGEKLQMNTANRQKQIGKAGLVSRLWQDSSNVVRAIAQDLIQDGRLADGLAMLELANQVSEAFRFLLKALSDSVTFPNAAKNRRELQQYAQSFVEKTGTPELTDQVAQNVCLLLDLITFFDLVETQDYRKAIIVIQNIKILPLEQKFVKTALAVFRNDLLPEVKECIPYVCLQFMHALVKQYSDEKDRLLCMRYGVESGATLRGTSLSSAGARLCDEIISVQTGYRKQARAVLEFANQIPAFQLPGLVELLIKLESTIS
ncbi:hypothetical protein RvY_05238 [Ramazzottius varieornatus]|uniref:Nuclear pore protein n=1 Tax=Ramazzottius varieornatus TaxID=947166 RepID=A0A1D1V010_RAMVA|nr:hypothetical protein RvY_05238 [Ramazzottius varieornatus]